MKKLLLRSRIVIGVSLTASVAALLAVSVMMYFMVQMTPVTDISGVAEKCLPASTMILTEKTIGTEDSGENVQEAATGIIWEKETDTIYIATNNHVVKNATKIFIRFGLEKAQGMLIPGEIVGREASSDLAVISVSKKDIPDEIYRELKPAVLGSSKETKVGQTAILIGNALGEGINVSCGIVSAVNRRQDGDEFHSEVLVSDAAVNFGNSGSMLVDKKGRVIGINTSKDSKDSSEGMGYYVPVDVAKKVVDQLLESTH